MILGLRCRPEPPLAGETESGATAFKAAGREEDGGQPWRKRRSSFLSLPLRSTPAPDQLALKNSRTVRYVTVTR